MAGSKHIIKIAVKTLVVSGGGWVILIAFCATAIQFNLRAVAQGQMPVGVALRLGVDSLPVLLFLFIVGILSIGLAFRNHKNVIFPSLVWILFGGLLLYGVYLARFSIGIFLLPSGLSLLVGGILFLV